MTPKLSAYNKTRIKRFYEIVYGYLFYGDVLPLDISYCPSGQTVVPPEKRKEGTFCKGHVGDYWGGPWDNAWFHITATIPKEWRAKNVMLRLDFSGEALMFDDDGVPTAALCHGSVFDPIFYRNQVILTPKQCKAGKVDLWIEAIASDMGGVGKQHGLPSGLKNPPMSVFEAYIQLAEMRLFRPDIVDLRRDLDVIISMLETIPEDDYRARRIRYILNEAEKVFDDNPDNAAACRAVLQGILGLPAMASALNVTGIGHAHIDVAWYWRVKEATRKAARTFANQIWNIEHYPDYVFGASQPYNYSEVKAHYPKLYEKVKRAVKSGNWEPQGGMWIEADCNIISGESMVRQFVHGKNFFMDEFGVEVKSLWMPDVFGYSAALPQILKLARCDYFVTAKITWNQINEFPYHTFYWRGIDGSQIFSHFPPEHTYNAGVMPKQLIAGQNNFSETGKMDCFLSIFGVGDGGGGPNEEHLERAIRMKNLEGTPKFSFGRAGDFLRHAEKEFADKTPVWVGELYFERHRGTLTTQAFIKRANRKNEQRLQTLEFLAAQGKLKDYPRKNLDTLWKNLLTYQFHDILPGSSIREVYDDARIVHGAIEQQADALIEKAAARIFPKAENHVVLVNTLSYDYRGTVVLPESYRGYIMKVAGTKQELCAQDTPNGVAVAVDIPALGKLELVRGKKRLTAPQVLPKSKTLVLENELVRYVFKPNAEIIEAYDKQNNRAILLNGKTGNKIQLFTDRPVETYNEAWDVDEFTREYPAVDATATATPERFAGEICDGIVFHLGIDRSTLTQRVTLAHDSAMLVFETTAEWDEDRKLLQTSFPIDVHTTSFASDIQYGYLMRPTHTNTTWEFAKFETPMHRYVDISDENYGVALLNDCKYACTGRDSTLMMTLLRAPKYPDYFADLGHHVFSYAFMPHAGRLVDSDVIAQSAIFNRAPLVLDGYADAAFAFPLAIEDDGVSVEVVKMAEKENARVLRLVETKGRSSSATLRFGTPQHVVETDLLEWAPVSGGIAPKKAVLSIKLAFRPFEIKTLKVIG